MADAVWPDQTRARPANTDAAYFTNALLRTHDGRTVRFYDDLLKGSWSSST